MARSMTGFGVGRATGDGLSVAVEVRSVNNRFLDLNLKLPRQLYEHESTIRDLVRKRINRGRVSLFITEEWSDNHCPDIRINKGKAKRYCDLLENLKDELNLLGNVQLDHMLTFPDLFVTADDEKYRNQLWNLANESVKIALDQLVESENSEGETLIADLKQRIACIRESLCEIEKYAKEQVHTYQHKLLARLEELLGESRLDPMRLEMEIALTADRLDISEEIVRLKSHLDTFEMKLDLSEPIGKTLGFILQEIGREVNTLTSKSWLADISQIGIKMKESVEQIREQVQNIE